MDPDRSGQCKPHQIQNMAALFGRFLVPFKCKRPQFNAADTVTADQFNAQSDAGEFGPRAAGAWLR